MTWFKLAPVLLVLLALGVLSVLESWSTLQVILWSLFGCALVSGAVFLLNFWRRPHGIGFRYDDESSFTPSPENFVLASMLTYPAASDHVIDRVYLRLNEDRLWTDCITPLQVSWRITNRQALLETLENLRIAMQRQEYTKIVQTIPRLSVEAYESLVNDTPDPARRFQYEMARKNALNIQQNNFLAWELVRIPYLARLGVNVRYLTDEEFFRYCLPVARVMQVSFRSWQHLLDDFLAGRIFWAGCSSDASVGLSKRVHKAMLEDKQSPCNKISWDTPLGVDVPRAVIMPDKVFWPIIHNIGAKTSFSTFATHLRTTLEELDVDMLFAFQNKFTELFARLDDPKIRFAVGRVLFPNEDFINPFKAWALFQGQKYVQGLLDHCDEALADVVDQFYDLRSDDWQLRGDIIQVMFDSASVFDIGRQVAKAKQLNPMLRYITLEEIQELVVFEPFKAETVSGDFPELCGKSLVLE